ncbi:HAD family hydrolase [Haematomicrobium sanguinis]|uniref:HAD family hydrolase n=1 Tax=Haematomicrobium sanguinis TaxID=479106 RepID=UPI00068971CC|nr:HAD-IB family hydrolase [Haematomicrobium sanguinis]
MPEPTGQTLPLVGGTLPRNAEAAFFDVDNTLMRGASLFHAARKMYEHRAFTLGDAAGFAWKQFLFSLRGENLDHVNSIRDSALGIIKGVKRSEVAHVGEEVFDEMISSRIWPGARALANQHIQSGRRVWLVSGTPIEIAGVIADKLGLTGALGTVGEVLDGVYTGRLVGDFLHGPAKAAAVQDLAEREGLNLENCWAYSDSHHDLPLLTMVGHPVAINPDAKLRKYAKEHRWPVYDFRSGTRAATWGLKAATLGGIVYGVGKGVRLALRRR